MAELVDIVVYRGILLNIEIALGHVGLRLVVVVVRDEILHGILREEFPHLAVELGRKGLIVSKDERGLIERSNNIRHGKSLARPSGSKQSLKLVALAESLHKSFYRLGLVPGRRERRREFKSVHI